MNNETFTNLVERRLQHCADMLATKNNEYSSDTDRLHNFKLAARLDNEEPIAALWGMWKKHIVSIIDIKDRMICDPTYCPTPELLDEKLGDNINYTLLFEAIAKERENDRADS